MEITADGNHVVMQHEEEPRLYVRSLPDGAVVCTLEHPDTGISAFAVAANPQLLALGDEAGLINIWNVVTGDMVNKASANEAKAPITTIAFSNDCHELYVANTQSTKIGVFQLPQLRRTSETEALSGVPVRLVPTWTGASLLSLCDDLSVQMILLEPVEGYHVQPLQSVGGAAARRGSLANCFPLPGSNQLCCYFGESSFDYYGIPSGGLAGSQSPEFTPTPDVALTPDGRISATGFPDGRVRFYKMPGPGKSLAVKRRDLVQQLVSLLSEEKFDELERLASEALTQNELDRSRWSPAMLLEFTYHDPEGQTDNAWQERLAKLRKWHEAKPMSRAACFMLGKAHSGYAWFLRGRASAAQTTARQFQGFHEQLTKADALLSTADDMGAPSAMISNARIRVAMGLTKPRDEITRIWERGIQDASGGVFLHTQAVKACCRAGAATRGTLRHWR